MAMGRIESEEENEVAPGANQQAPDGDQREDDPHAVLLEELVNEEFLPANQVWKRGNKVFKVSKLGAGKPNVLSQATSCGYDPTGCTGIRFNTTCVSNWGRVTSLPPLRRG